MGRLVLTRKTGESIRIDTPMGAYNLTFQDFRGNRAHFVFDGPIQIEFVTIRLGEKFDFCGGSIQWEQHRSSRDIVRVLFDLPREINIVRRELVKYL